jgi:hypothetical protein
MMLDWVFSFIYYYYTRAIVIVFRDRRDFLVPSMESIGWLARLHERNDWQGELTGLDP